MRALRSTDTVDAMSDSPTEIPEAAASARRPAWLWPVAAVAIVVVIATAVVLSLTLGNGSSPVPVAATSRPVAVETPSPTPGHLDERTACQVLAPAVQDGTTAIKDLIAHPDGTTIDKTALNAAIDSFQQVQADGPADLQNFVDTATTPLVDLNSALSGGGNKTIGTQAYALAAQAILDRCAPYGP